MPETMGQTLTKKAGPLPVWAWLGIGTIGVGGFLYIRQRQQAATAASQDTQGLGSSNLGNVPISDLTTQAQPMPIQMGDTFVDVTTPPTTVSTPITITNPPPSNSPAKPAPGTPSKPPVTAPKPPATKLPTAPKPVAPAPKAQTVTVCAFPGWCGSLWGIAQHFYGNGADWQTIYNANKAKIGSNPNLIHVGQVLTIPAKP